MKVKRIARKLSNETKEIIREMHSRGLTYNEISDYTEVLRSAINNLVIVWNKGLSGLTELAEYYARRSGYNSLHKYQMVLHYSKNPDNFHGINYKKTLKQRFEENLEEKAERIDVIDEETPSPDLTLESQEKYLQLREALKRLKEEHSRGYEIIIKRFYEERTLEEIGKEYGVTRERVRQIGSRSLDHLRDYLGSRNPANLK